MPPRTDAAERRENRSRMRKTTIGEAKNSAKNRTSSKWEGDISALRIAIRKKGQEKIHDFYTGARGNMALFHPDGRDIKQDSEVTTSWQIKEGHLKTQGRA